MNPIRPTLIAVCVIAFAIVAAGCGAGSHSATPRTSAGSQATSATVPAASQSPLQTAAAPSVTPFDGVYRMVTTEAQLRAADPNTAYNWGRWIFVFDRGHFAITQENPTGCAWGYGTYNVTGHQIEWTYTDGRGTPAPFPHNAPGERFTFDWSIYRDAVTLTAVPGKSSPAELIYPWRRLSTKPSISYLSKGCRPPTDAMPN